MLSKKQKIALVNGWRNVLKYWIILFGQVTVIHVLQAFQGA